MHDIGHQIETQVHECDGLCMGIVTMHIWFWAFKKVHLCKYSLGVCNS